MKLPGHVALSLVVLGGCVCGPADWCGPDVCPAPSTCVEGICVAPAEDAGSVDDAGTDVDAGVIADAGSVIDAGSIADAGSIIDAGSMIDAGSTLDAGHFIDAGSFTDAGPIDAGPGFISDGGLLCTHGWCWLNPLPQGDTFTEIHGTSATDVWFSTEGGSALHWNGSRWRLDAVSPNQSLTAIWAAGPNDVWAVGRGIYRFNGSSWSADAGNTTAITQPLASIWGSAPNDIWAVGQYSTAVRFDGATWNRVNNIVPFSSELQKLRGRNASDVHVVGQGGSFASFDGGSWATHNGFGGGWIYTVWPAAPNDVWVGGAGQLARWNGTTRTPFSESFANFKAIWGSAPNDIWITGSGSSNDLRHWDGNTLNTITPGRNGNALWGSAQNDVWLGGQRGRLSHFDGSAWSDVSRGISPGTRSLWSCAPNSVWVVGTYAIAHYDGTELKAFTPAPPGNYSEVWCSSDTDVWVLSSSGIQRWNGASWSTVATPGLTFTAGAIWGTGPNDVWLTGGGLFARWNGTTWDQFTPTGSGATGAERISGSSSNNVWFTGTDNQVFQWDGTTLHRRTTADVYDKNVDVWVSPTTGRPYLVTRIHSGVGSDILLQQWTGTAWTRTPAPATAALFPFTIGGASDSDIWIMGWDEPALHWDGAALSVVPKGTTLDMTRIRRGPSGLYALGVLGELLVH